MERTNFKSKIMLQAISILAFMLVFLVGCGVSGNENSVSGEASAAIEKQGEIETDKEQEKRTREEQDKEEKDEEKKNVELSHENEEESGAHNVENPIYISKEFLELLSSTLEQDNMVEVLTPMIKDQELSAEKMQVYQSDEVVAEYLSDERNPYKKIFLRVDADNDGIQDLFVWMNDGGSMGNNSRILLQGQADGSFLCTDMREGITQELCFVSFDDKNYLLETTYDYYIKEVTGYKVSEYQNGEVAEAIYVEWEKISYETDTLFCAAGVEDLAQRCEEDGKDGFHETGSAGWTIVTGSAETEIREADRLEQCAKELLIKKVPSCLYSADINNDGEEEYYTKYIFYPSTLYTKVSMDTNLYFPSLRGKEYQLTSYYDFQYDGTPLFFWVDDVTIDGKKKQIICILCYDGADKEMVYGYLIESEKIELVLHVELEAVKEVIWKKWGE